MYLNEDALKHGVLWRILHLSDLLTLNEFDIKQAKMGRGNYLGNI